MLLLVAGSGCLDGRAPPVASGREIYLLHCSSCHQLDGRGYDEIYPALAGNRIVRFSDPQPVIDIVEHGRGSMPPFSDELTPTELADVITYIRAAWRNGASAVSPVQTGS